MTDRVLIVGAGSWGTAMAVLMADAGAEVTLLGRRAEFMQELAAQRVNEVFLPGVPLPESLTLTADRPGLDDFDWCFCAVPTSFIRTTFAALAEGYPQDLPVVSLSKGIEQDSLAFPSRILQEVTGAKQVLALSGPSHAEEVAAKLPASVVCAGDSEVSRRLQRLISTPTFRAYASTDLLGVELAGAAKNVVAIAAGIVEGLELGDNTKAALLSRGLAEIARLGACMGAEARTFYGLSGVGDLYATCASQHGRNRAFGKRVGEGESAEAIVKSMAMVVEGYNTARALKTLSEREGVEMPIVDEVCKVIYQGYDPRKAVNNLMTRSLKSE